MTESYRIAKQLADVGISTVPIADLVTKRPLVKWQDLQTRTPTEAELADWYKIERPIAMVCGSVQCIDLDIPADGSDQHIEGFENVCYATGMGDILAELPYQTSPSGGRHYFFRTHNPAGNQKLANNSLGEVLIETRGKGGYVLIAPSDGYELVGDLDDIPLLDDRDIAAILENARSFDEGANAIDYGTRSSGGHSGVRPGDAYDHDLGAFFDLLRAHGWDTVGNVNHWRRPGKRNGISATWDKIPGRFYVFSSSADPLQPNHAYSPFAVYAILQHNGNFSEAAAELGRRGYGEQIQNTIKKARESLQEAVARLDVGLPPPRPYQAFTDEEKAMPEVLIDGLLYRGGKLLIGAPSKARKTWMLQHLALAVANGGNWLGFQCDRMPVLYLDLELLQPDSLGRFDKISRKSGFWDLSDLHVWALRGYAVTLKRIKPMLVEYAHKHGIGMIVIDPFYRISAGAVENSAEEVAVFLAELEEVIRECNCSLAMSHHFAKGNAAGKDAIDRFSGSGVFARDPDALIVMTEAEESSHDLPVFAMEVTARSFEPPQPRVLAWQFPIWHMARQGKTKLKQGSGRPPKNTVEDVLRHVPKEGIRTTELKNLVDVEEGISKASYHRLKKEAFEKGLMVLDGELLKRSK